MAVRPQRRSPWRFAGYILAALLVAGAIVHTRNVSAETRLFNLGAEVYFSRPLPGLLDRLAETRNKTIAEYGPKLIQRTFGHIVTVDIGRKYDVSKVSPSSVMAELTSLRGLEVVMIDRLPLDDQHLMQFAGVKKLRELGLRNTKVTDEGVARLTAARPDLTVRNLGNTPEE